MSTSQAAKFANTYAIVDQYSDSSTGLSATVFQQSGQYYLAIRGTNDVLDVLADAQLLFGGAARGQIVSLYNYVQRLITPAGQSAIQVEDVAPDIDPITGYVNDPGGIRQTASAASLGYLSGVSGVTVTGHSLGGHLAAAASRLFPTLIGSANTYDAPGFSLSYADALLDQFPGDAGTFPSGIINLVAETGGIVIPNIGSLPGTPRNIYIEDQGAGIPGNHGIVPLTDSLAIYDLFAKIDPTLNTTDPAVGIGKITDVLKAASNKPALSLEASLDALRKLFKDPAVQNLTPTVTDDRNAFYTNLYDTEFQNRISGYTDLLSIESLVDKDTTTIEANAFGDIAYRYALKALNPFAVLGEDGIYDQFNQNSELDVYDSSTGTGTLTSEYVTDRAAFLAWKIKLGQLDLAATVPGDGSVALFEDKATGQKAYLLPSLHQSATTAAKQFRGLVLDGQGRFITFGSDDPTVVDNLPGDAAQDRLYGGAGNDVLNGLGQDDYLQGDAGDDLLVGGTGNDIVNGGKDNDVLDGGLDNDTYVWNTGDGLDTILDAREDGGTGTKQGTLQFLNQSLAGVKTQVSADNPGLFTDGQGVLYAFYGVTSGEGTLFITKPLEAGGLTVRGFRSGDFGIDLGPVAPIQKAEKFGTAEADNGSDPNSPIYNDAPNEKLFGLGGDDGFLITKSGTEGYGGLGQDFIYAPDLNGSHKLFGEENRDILITWGGNNELYGGLDDDALTGGIGEDYLEGNDNSDVLAGNLGQDALVGGEGADYLLGGSSYSAGNFNWSVTVIPETHTVLFNQFNGDGFLAGDGGDLLKGEAGADYMWGGEGDDALYGGTEDDYLEGDEDSDLLFGEDGNDTLWGDRDVAAADRHGQDYLDGGAGNDELFGEGDADILIGSAGADYLQGDDETGIGEGADFLDGGIGNDTLRGGGGDDYLDGGDDIDQLVGGAGLDELFGGAGDDLLLGEADDDYLDGEDGADQLSGGDGNDVLFGGIGADTMVGDAGDDYIDGEADNDLIAGGDGNDEIYGDAGLDELQGGIGDDTLDGGTDDDLLFGEAGVDVLSGGDGNDQLSGGDDNDTISGDAGNDTARGGAGNDFLDGDAGDDVLLGDAGNDMLSGGDGIDELQGGADDDTLDGGADNDVLFGEAGNDVLSGGEGDDQIVGSDGADTLDGGAGNDTQFGDAGNDTYLFGRGSGQDGIVDQDLAAGNVDRVEFAADLTPDDITASRSFNDLLLTINGTTDTLRIYSHFDTSNAYRVEEIRFADGTVWTPTSTPLLISGSSASDVINGTAGPDVIESGAGSDVISGGTGNDTYRYYRGDGADYIFDFDATAGNLDKILFAADILPSQVQAERSGSDLRLTLTATDSVAVNNYFQNDGATPYSVEQIKFLADGTIWDVNTVKNLVLTPTSGDDSIIGYATNDTLIGLGGDDALTGNAGDDTLDGGTGNDVLQGGIGNDTYLIARGDGQDTITDVDATAGNADKIVYAADILHSEMQATRSGNNLVLKLAGATDQVTVTNYFENDGVTASSVEQIQFLADGTVWDVNTVKSLVIAPTSGDDNITGYGTDDTLSGLGGNDVIHGSGGNDTLDGGAGNDSLFGEGDSDTYLFARGDGQDVINNAASDTAGSTDVLSFAADILPSEVTPTRDGNDLNLAIQGSTDQVRIQNYFLSGQNVVEQIRFADGTVWTEQTILTFLPPPPVVGTENNDTIVGTSASEFIKGLGGDDAIRGGGGNDTFEGGAGEDTLIGSTGNDTYLFNLGDGGPGGFFITGDDISDAGGYDVLQFGTGISPSGVTVLDGGSGSNRYLVLSPSETPGGVYILGYFSTGHIEEIRFQDGTVWTDEDIAPLVAIWGSGGDDIIVGTGIADVIYGFSGNDTVFGSAGNDDLYGYDGNDQLYGQLGNDELYGDAGADLLDGGDGNDVLGGGLGADTLYGQAGNDTLIAGAGESKNAKVSNLLYGGAGDDVLISSGKTDFLYGEDGNDILLGATARDWIEDTGGNNLINGGGAIDDIWMGDQNDLVIGGTGDDLLDGDRDADGIRGLDILAFNKSDGKDSVSRLGSGSTISIGGGTLYTNLSFEVVGTALRLKTGSNHYISLNDWYGSSANKAISTLQIVIEGTRDYKATSNNPMNNKKIQAFDFLGLIAAFDAAGRPSNFNVASNLANYRLWSSDTDAIGGAVAYQYARTGSTGTLSYDQMRAVLAAPEFGASAQPIAVTASSATALTTDSSAETMTVAAESFTIEASALMTTDMSTATLDSADISSPPETDNATENASPNSPTLIDRPDHWIAPEPALRVIPHVPPVITGPIGAFSPDQIRAAPTGFAFGVASQPTPAAGSAGTTPASNNSSGATATTSEGFSSGAPSRSIMTDSSAAGPASTDGSGASGTGTRTESSPLAEPLDGLVANWFARGSSHEDLSLLDDIARGEGAENSSASDAEIAAAWQRSHQWLKGRLNSGSSYGGDDGDGADLGAMSFLGDTGTFIDMPRPVVGLRNVAGHDLKPFSGLQEGVSVLAQ